MKGKEGEKEEKKQMMDIEDKSKRKKKLEMEEKGRKKGRLIGQGLSDTPYQ